MSKLVNELDHVLCKVHDADEAAGAFEKLGFVSTPLSPMKGLGIGNRLIIFPQRKEGCLNFIELLAVTHAPDVRPNMAALLEGREGPKSLILSGADAGSARDRFKAMGFEFDAPNVVERDWHMPNGDIEKPAFSILPPLAQQFSFAYLEYLNLAPYARPEWLGHTNGITGLTGVIGVSEDPKAAIEPLARIFNCPAIRGEDGLYSTSPGEIQLKIGTADDVSERFGETILPGERYVGLELGSEKISTTEQIFNEAQAEIASVRTGFAVRSTSAVGIALAIEQS